MLTPREVAESYWRAECARDVEAVLGHYTEDATFAAPGWSLRGHDEIRLFYEASGLQFPGLEVDIVSETHGTDGSVVFEWVAVLIDPLRVRFPLRGVNLVTLRDGQFTGVRAYFDTSTLGGGLAPL